MNPVISLVIFAIIGVGVVLLFLGFERNDPDTDSGRDFPRGRPSSGGG
jgi:hypothetical protein